MAGYRCYLLNLQGRIAAAENIEAEGLDEAIEQGLAMLGKRPQHASIEIWQGALRLFASGDDRPRHQCHIYEGAPSKTLPTMALLIAEKLQENTRCLYFNSPTMIVGLKYYLTSSGVDVEGQLRKGALQLSAERDHLSGGFFNVDAMLATLESAIDQAVSDGYRGLWASGDMTWEIGDKCTVGELLDYEWRLEQIFRRRAGLSGICQYHADTLPRDIVRHGLAAHRSVFVNETLSRVNPHYLAPFMTNPTPHPGLDEIIDGLCAESRRLA